MQQIILIEREEGGYIAEVPTLPTCTSQGNTAREAINNVMKAMALHHLTSTANNSPAEAKRSSGLRAFSTIHMR
jgi:predicted RNase H-like HicB family nuclease